MSIEQRVGKLERVVTPFRQPATFVQILEAAREGTEAMERLERAYDLTAWYEITQRWQAQREQEQAEARGETP